MTQGIGRPLNPWRQGCQVDGQHALAMNWVQAEEAECLLIVVAHDCDLQAAAEFEVELLRASIVEKASPDCTHGKNPRTLHLPEGLGVTGTLEISQLRPLRVPKDRLLESEPISALSDADRRELASWLASRYKRAAFPDSFDLRLRRAKTIDHLKLDDKNIARIKKDRSLSKQLLGVFTSDGGPIEGIYIGLMGKETVELESAQDYSLVIVVVAKSRGAAEEEAGYSMAAELAKKVRGLFEHAAWDSAAGKVILKVCEPTTELDFSLYNFRRMLKWHLDWLSEADDTDFVSEEASAGTIQPAVLPSHKSDGPKF